MQCCNLLHNPSSTAPLLRCHWGVLKRLTACSLLCGQHDGLGTVGKVLLAYALSLAPDDPST